MGFRNGEALILKKLEILENRVTTPVEIRKALSCNICQGIASPPIVYSCCQRVVACDKCNQRQKYVTLKRKPESKENH